MTHKKVFLAKLMLENRIVMFFSELIMITNFDYNLPIEHNLFFFSFTLVFLRKII